MTVARTAKRHSQHKTSSATGAIKHSRYLLHNHDIYLLKRSIDYDYFGGDAYKKNMMDLLFLSFFAVVVAVFVVCLKSKVHRMQIEYN